MTPFAAQDREVAAGIVRELEQAHPGWQVWYGVSSYDFHAMHEDVPGLLIKRSPVELGELMTAWDQWLLSRRAPVEAHGDKRR